MYFFWNSSNVFLFQKPWKQSHHNFDRWCFPWAGEVDSVVSFFVKVYRHEFLVLLCDFDFFLHQALYFSLYHFLAKSNIFIYIKSVFDVQFPAKNNFSFPGD